VRTLLFCLIVAVSQAAAPSVRAQQTQPLASAGDLDLVASCLQDAKDQPYACIGRVEKPCLDEPGAETTGGAVACATREQVVWNERAQLSMKAIRDKLEPARLKLFNTADEAWSKHRDASCAYEASIYEGGSLARLVRADCLLRETALRAISLDGDLSLTIDEEIGSEQ
jgi:uncharacterized protein YecT (DUF1311 family)